VRDAAFFYANLGIPIFPITKGCKAPPLVRWSLYATDELEVVQQWWQRWPQANIGAPTGKWCDVIDVEGEFVGQFTDQYGEIPRSYLVVSTPSQGVHIYLRPEGHRRSSSKMRSGIGDLKGVGGYVLLPPSQVGHRYYTFRVS
jgi:hypothetical protein